MQFAFNADQNARVMVADIKSAIDFVNMHAATPKKCYLIISWMMRVVEGFKEKSNPYMGVSVVLRDAGEVVSKEGERITAYCLTMSYEPRPTEEPLTAAQKQILSEQVERAQAYLEYDENGKIVSAYKAEIE